MAIVSDIEIRLRADIARLQQDMNAARRSVDGGMASIRGAVAATAKAMAGLGLGLSLIGLIKQVISAQREFDKLNSSLYTATGSSMAAAGAFKALQAFAASTPYSVAEATEAFIKLRNLGLTPSERALRSYGNTSAAMGKGLNQMIEAVADAATGEFERLKEFGIKSKQNGDKVLFTFQGVTKSIGNNAKDIEKYLMAIGEVEFAGAMERRANTLDGAISNLGDTWASVMRAISSNGFGEGVMAGVLALSGALTDLSAIIDAVGGAAHKEGEQVKEAAGLHTVLTTIFETVAVLGLNVAYVFTEVGKELGGLAAQAAAVARGDFAGAAAIGAAMRADAEADRAAVDAKSAAILGAAAKAQEARDKEADSIKKSGTDRLAGYAKEISAEEKRNQALLAVMDITNKLNGVDKDTAGNLVKLKTALDTGAISQKEYNRYVAQIQKETTEASTAYKNQVKALDMSADAIKRRAAAQAFANQQDAEHLAFLNRTGQLNDADYAAKKGASELRTLKDNKAALEAQLVLENKRIDNKAKIADMNGQIAAAEAAINAKKDRNAEAEFEVEQKSYREAAANRADLIEGAQATTQGLRDQLLAQDDNNDAMMLTGQQLAALAAQRLRDEAARLTEKADLAELVDANGELAAQYREQAELKTQLADGTEYAKDLERFLDPSKAQTFGETLRSAFGAAADGMGQLIGALSDYTTKQDEADRARKAAMARYGADSKAYAVVNEKITQQELRDRVGAYGDMTGAAKMFFKEGSRGYEVLETAEKAFRAVELALAVQSMVKKIFYKEGEVAANLALNGAKLTGEATTSAASTGLAATEASAWGITAVVKALASLPFPMNLAAGAATLAAVVAVGAKMFGSLGGSGVSLSEQRQKDQGTGSVLGDTAAKSESIKKSLDLVEKNTYQGLAISTGILATLRSIDTNITAFASQLVRNTDVTNPNVGPLNSNNGGATTGFGVGMGAAIGAYFGPVGAVIGAFVGLLAKNIPVIGRIATSIFGGKQTVEDSGFTLTAASLSSIVASGVKASQYASIKTSGGWFSSDKTSEKSTPLSDADNRQFTAIVVSTADSVKAAGAVLGIAADKLDAFVVDIKVSLKDLKGDELQKAIEAVFSKLGDDMAAFAVGGLEPFQQAGEGYLETLVRIASEYQTVDTVFQSFGKTFGAVGMASVEARDRLVQMAGGLDAFTSQSEYFLSNFFSEQERAAALLARVQPVLDQYGLQASGEGAMRALRDVVVGLDTTTEAGAQTWAALMGVAPAIKALADAEKGILDERRGLQDQMDELTMTSAQLHAKERDAINESNRALYDQVSALKALAAGLQSNEEFLRGLVDSSLATLGRAVDAQKARVQAALADTLRGLDTSIARVNDTIARTGDLSKALKGAIAAPAGADDTARTEVARAAITTALAIAKASGVLPTAESMADALAAVTQDNSDNFATLADYQRATARTNAELEALGGLTDDQLDTATLQLQVLEAQKVAAQAAADAELQRLDDILANAHAELDAINGVNSSVLSVAAALGAVQVALGALKTAPTAGNPNAAAGITTVEDLYHQVLGRDGEAAGIAFWKRAFGDAVDQSEYLAFVKAAQPELQGMLQAPPTVVTSSGTMSGSSPAMSSEQQQINARMEASMARTATAVEQLAQQFNQVSAGGNALATESI